VALTSGWHFFTWLKIALVLLGANVFRGQAANGRCRGNPDREKTFFGHHYYRNGDEK